MSERVPLAEPLLKPDVARLLRVPRSTVYELGRRQGDPIPCLRLGRAVRYERRELEAWLARQRSQERSDFREALRLPAIEVDTRAARSR